MPDAHTMYGHTRAVRSTVIHVPDAHTMYGHTRAVRSTVIHVPDAHTMYGHTRAVQLPQVCSVYHSLISDEKAVITTTQGVGGLPKLHNTPHSLSTSSN